MRRIPVFLLAAALVWLALAPAAWAQTTGYPYAGQYPGTAGALPTYGTSTTYGAYPGAVPTGGFSTYGSMGSWTQYGYGQYLGPYSASGAGYGQYGYTPYGYQYVYGLPGTSAYSYTPYGYGGVNYSYGPNSSSSGYTPYPYGQYYYGQPAAPTYGYPPAAPTYPPTYPPDYTASATPAPYGVPGAAGTYAGPPGTYGYTAPPYPPAAPPTYGQQVAGLSPYTEAPPFTWTGAPAPPQTQTSGTSNASYTLGQYYYGIGVPQSVPYNVLNTTLQLTPYNAGALASYLTGVPNIPAQGGQPGPLLHEPIQLGP
jgi:hypothetical protein